MFFFSKFVSIMNSINLLFYNLGKDIEQRETAALKESFEKFMKKVNEQFQGKIKKTKLGIVMPQGTLM